MSKTEVKKFEVGDRVRWESQAQGSYVVKHGRVVAVVPAGFGLEGALKNQGLEFSDFNCATLGGGGSRHSESYAVELPGSKFANGQWRKRPCLYWPRTCALIPDL